MEFLLVVGIDEPQLAVDDSIARLMGQLLKTLNGHPSLLDGQQLLYHRWRSSAEAEQQCVEHIGQQVDERQLRGDVDTYLLVAAKRSGWRLQTRRKRPWQNVGDKR